jgi:hypothetical protein
MVLKQKNKVSKRLKKGMCGGFFGFEFEFYNSVEKTDLKDDSILTLINEWTKFINLLSKYYFSLTKPDCKSEDSTECEEYISKEDFDKTLKTFLEKIEIVKAGKQNAFKENKDVSCSIKNSTDQQQAIKEVIENFDTQFEIILNKVKSDIDTTNPGKSPYNTMMGLVRNLPNINESLIKLTAINIQNLDQRYKVILEILGSVCSGFTAPFCSGAAKLLGKEVSTLYSKLKENSNKKDSITICDMILIVFIKDVLPIMITKLKNIDEFEDAYIKLIEINNKQVLGLKKIKVPIKKEAVVVQIKKEAVVEVEGVPLPGGGKKSSKSVHKEIQGKLMKIYRKPNDKKEYVKHKGVLISTKEYKEHMKQGAAITKKVILGKERCIYKVRGSKQDHVKYKGSLIPVADFKKLMKV